MRLHLDRNAFRVLLEDINARTGYRTDVMEKDYYVVLMLKELSERQKDGLPAYFKGGTALYKALKQQIGFLKILTCLSTPEGVVEVKATKDWRMRQRNMNRFQEISHRAGRIVLK